MPKISKLCLNVESRDHDKFSKLFYNNNKWNPKILFMKKNFFFRHVMVQKIPFFEKLTIFFPFFCPFFPFGGGYSTSLTLHVIELVMTFRMIGHMTNNQIYFYTKKHFEIMYYRFLQFLACIHRNGDIRLILCDNTFWLFRPNLGSWVQKLKHFFSPTTSVRYSGRWLVEIVGPFIDVLPVYFWRKFGVLFKNEAQIKVYFILR